MARLILHSCYDEPATQEKFVEFVRPEDRLGKILYLSNSDYDLLLNIDLNHFIVILYCTVSETDVHAQFDEAKSYKLK